MLRWEWTAHQQVRNDGFLKRIYEMIVFGTVLEAFKRAEKGLSVQMHCPPK